MTWKVTNVMDQRIEFVVCALQDPTSFSALCRKFEISRPTGYLWLARYRECGTLTALVNHSRRPHTSPTQTPPDVESQVIALRQRYGWGGKKLAILLARVGVDLPVVTINRIIHRHGLIDPQDVHRPATKRFERQQPNQLWQMDFKGEFRTAQSVCYPLSIIDDHSRFALGLYALGNREGKTTLPCLIEVFSTYGVPDAMLMDHGYPWCSSRNGYGLTTFAVHVIKQGIRLIHGRIAHPQTQGKVERFHRTLQEAMDRQKPAPETIPEWSSAFATFVHVYNDIRPHEALAMDVPAKHYRPSTQPYLSTPSPWTYPATAHVCRIDQLGMLSHHSQRYFISEALVGESVGVEVAGHTLIVRYRHMYIREIDTTSGQSLPFVHPVCDTSAT
jgi:transposase